MTERNHSGENPSPGEELSEERKLEIDVIYSFNDDLSDSLYPTLEEQAIQASSALTIRQKSGELPISEDELDSIVRYHRSRRSEIHWALSAGTKHPNYQKTKPYIEHVLSSQGINPTSFTLNELMALIKLDRGKFMTLKELLEKRQKRTA